MGLGRYLAAGSIGSMERDFSSRLPGGKGKCIKAGRIYLSTLSLSSPSTQPVPHCTLSGPILCVLSGSQAGGRVVIVMSPLTKTLSAGRHRLGQTSRELQQQGGGGIGFSFSLFNSTHVTLLLFMEI